MTVGGTVTVVIPTKNRPALLAEALRSVRGQIGLGAEPTIVVVDDGSETGEETAAVAARFDAALVRHEKSRGVSAARNSGIEAASGKWIAFLDDDDLWAPTKLCGQLALLEQEPDARWSATACVHVDSTRGVTGALRMPESSLPLFDLLLEANWVPAGGSSVLVSAALLAETGRFVDGVHGCEDWDMWIRFATRSPIAYLDHPLVAYRSWGGNASADPDLIRRGREWVLARNGRVRALGPDEMHWQQSLGRMYATRGRRLPAAQAFTKAWRLGGGVGQLLYVAASVVAPPLVVSRLAQQDRGIDPHWRADAEAWLREATEA